MAVREIIELTDDLDGSPAVETVEFALDGQPMVIDLNAKNARNLRRMLAEYVDHARRVGGRLKKGAVAKAAAAVAAPAPAKAVAAAKTGPRKAARTAADRPTTRGGAKAARPGKPAAVTFLPPAPADVRAWAKGRNIKVSPRGKIPDAVMALFQAASRGEEATKG